MFFHSGIYKHVRTRTTESFGNYQYRLSRTLPDAFFRDVTYFLGYRFKRNITFPVITLVAPVSIFLIFGCTDLIIKKGRLPRWAGYTFSLVWMAIWVGIVHRIVWLKQKEKKFSWYFRKGMTTVPGNKLSWIHPWTLHLSRWALEIWAVAFAPVMLYTGEIPWNARLSKGVVLLIIYVSVGALVVAYKLSKKLRRMKRRRQKLKL